MTRVHKEIRSFEIAALSPSEPGWYARLGWKEWRGPLLIPRGEEVIPTPDECVMVFAPDGRSLPDRDETPAAEWRPLEPW